MEGRTGEKQEKTEKKGGEVNYMLVHGVTTRRELIWNTNCAIDTVNLGRHIYFSVNTHTL